MKTFSENSKNIATNVKMHLNVLHRWELKRDSTLSTQYTGFQSLQSSTTWLKQHCFRDILNTSQNSIRAYIVELNANPMNCSWAHLHFWTHIYSVTYIFTVEQSMQRKKASIWNNRCILIKKKKVESLVNNSILFPKYNLLKWRFLRSPVL